VLTDLYVQKPTHSAAEERQYVELALRLVGAVDAATRQAVADRLATYPAAPAELLRHLEADLARRAVSEAAGDIAGNAEIAVGAPPARTAHAREITERFFAADAAERWAILSELGPIDQSPPADPEAINRNLEAAVLGGRPGDFIRQLEQSLAIPRAIAERIVNDLSGEPLVIAAKALAMPVDMLQRILLFVNPAIGQSVQRVYALSALYDELRTGAALHLVACWRACESIEHRAASRGVTRSEHARPALRADPVRAPEEKSSAHDVQKVAS
jgi:hypothetical protein